MTIDYHRLKSRQFEDIVQRYTERDTILYALGLGLGQDPLDPLQLPFVYEEGLRMLPAMPVVLASPGFWLQQADTGVDWRHVLHGEQGLVLHRALPVAGTVVGRLYVDEIVDKGHGRGALIYSRRELFDATGSELMCTLTTTSFCRADGGFGGTARAPEAPPPMPSRAPDAAMDWRIPQQAALIYRLSGDYNPLHASPEVAASAGLPRPVLHGLCTYGIAAYALARVLGENGGFATLRCLFARFSAPVFPGDTLVTEIWKERPGYVRLRCRVRERETVVLDMGKASYEHAA